MNKRFASLVVLTVFFCLPAAAQTADDIIAKHIAALGGAEKLKATKTLRLTGRFEVAAGIEAPFTLEHKLPDRMRMEFVVQGMTAVQAYDGKSGWKLIPFQGKKDPEPASEEENKDLKDQADLFGPLVDYKTKGNQVELVGKEKVEGADCYKLKVTLKDGDILYDYLDADSYLDVKIEGKRVMQGNEIEFETSMGDYKEVGGLMFPYAIEEGQKGGPQRQKIIVDKVEINVPIDDSRFTMPAVKPAETKPNPSLPPELAAFWTEAAGVVATFPAQ